MSKNRAKLYRTVLLDLLGFADSTRDISSKSETREQRSNSICWLLRDFSSVRIPNYLAMNYQHLSVGLASLSNVVFMTTFACYILSYPS